MIREVHIKIGFEDSRTYGPAGTEPRGATPFFVRQRPFSGLKGSSEGKV